ncbi:transcriptional regulator, XRE family [Candidatus Magnetobacterium bavaricum]|uniref:Transcriptional regulator, XRE family n=1 Tax=Candidatus Magnetobacterium bavaricum TaxID=29290 RepID=A0A0F3GWY3_9BACT|nr:transcriptional regulator, XRE family [Candidatus Magnetobacterium bavaricum]
MIGKKIKEIRLAADLTQTEFGKRLGISKPFVSDLEREQSYPTYLLLKKIITEFKVDCRWLFDVNKL